MFHSSFLLALFIHLHGPVWNNHVDLGLWADLILIAPATANTLSKMAHGTCDNLLLAVYLSAKCPVYYAPAMDLDMYKHPSTLKSFEQLNRFGNIQIPAGVGELASGLYGQGRMAEPAEIVDFVESDLLGSSPLYGKKVLITAGPTYEAIDPVRFIGNHSSGKMGFALARAAASKGGQVELVTGPTALEIEHPAIRMTRVTDARQMYSACVELYPQVDLAILSAAVADYRPVDPADQKIKKKSDQLSLSLVKNPDILAQLGKDKKDQILVGFALETENETEHAKAKIQKKNLDLIVLNSLRDPGAGFGKDTNKVTLIDKDNKQTPFEVKDKQSVAEDIVQHIIDKFYA